MRNHPLIAIHEGKYYKRTNDLALGPGCFTHGLEYAASTKAIIVGKPNQYFFENAIPAGCQTCDCVMIGDVSFNFVMFMCVLNNEINNTRFVY